MPEKFDKKEIYSHYSKKVMMLFADVVMIEQSKVEENIRNKNLPKSAAKFGKELRAEIATGKKKADYDFEKNELTIWKSSKGEKDTWWTRQKDRAKVAAWVVQGGKYKEVSV